jgi:hypothetical protein
MDAPPAPPDAAESAHDRHARELEHSVEVLEDTVEHWLVRALKIAVPLVLGVFLAAVGSYILGNRMRDRAERRRIARVNRRTRPRLIVVDPASDLAIPAGAYVAEAAG